VRVPLHGRRVRGWVVADSVTPETEERLLELLAVASQGPPAEVVALADWIAWRWRGPKIAVLRSASPPNRVPPDTKPEPAWPRSHIDGVLTPVRSLVVVGPHGLRMQMTLTRWRTSEEARMIGTGICRIIDILERRFVITKHKRQKYRCRCSQCVETAPGPVKFFAGARYSPNFAVIVAVASYAIFEWMGAVYYLLAGVLIGNVWEAWRRVHRRTGYTFPSGVGVFVREVSPWRVSR